MNASYRPPESKLSSDERRTYQSLRVRIDTALDTVTPILRDRAAQVDAAAAFPYESISSLHAVNLLTLGFSQAHGGAGFGRESPFSYYFDTVTAIARACSNTAQLFTVQTGALYTLELIADPSLVTTLADEVHTHAATFCFTAAEPDERFTYDNKRTNLKSFARRTSDGEWIVYADKAFATGSVGCRYALFQCATAAAQHDGSLEAKGAEKPPESVLVLLPRDHPAVGVHDTWNGIGQRATTSGRLTVRETRVASQWIVGNPALVPDAAILAPFYQLGFAAILLGIGEAALDDTLDFVATQLKPTNGFGRASDEPALQGHIADIRIALSASRALIGEASRAMDAFLQGDADIADVLVAVYQAKVHASSSALEAGSRLFQVGGARSATRDIAADRHWRNARTLTLHDSVDKQKGVIARHVLGIERPNVSTR